MYYIETNGALFTKVLCLGIYWTLRCFMVLVFCVPQVGPRICLGKDSAYLQMKMALAILRRFHKFSLVPGQPVKYRMMTTLSMAHGLKLTIARRS